ncbi:hypothetical protein SHKM778_67210 [Streptomyces sp. KM77-8]|uniref:Uncharacterized protein n=1 Tax=Streptomyces haneummycinicus TaxID=3074435 RepID=A0AAT9HT56_9ACTN
MWTGVPLGLFVPWDGRASGALLEVLPHPVDDLLRAGSDRPVTLGRLAEYDGRVWLLAVAAALMMLLAGVLTAVRTPVTAGAAAGPVAFAGRCARGLGVATALTLPLLAWLTEVSANASLSVLGFDTFDAGIELHGRPGMALLLGAVWGRGRERRGRCWPGRAARRGRGRRRWHGVTWGRRAGHGRRGTPVPRPGRRQPPARTPRGCRTGRRTRTPIRICGWSGGPEGPRGQGLGKASGGPGLQRRRRVVREGSRDREEGACHRAPAGPANRRTPRPGPVAGQRGGTRTSLGTRGARRRPGGGTRAGGGARRTSAGPKTPRRRRDGGRGHANRTCHETRGAVRGGRERAGRAARRGHPRRRTPYQRRSAGPSHGDRGAPGRRQGRREAAGRRGTRRRRGPRTGVRWRVGVGMSMGRLR